MKPPSIDNPIHGYPVLMLSLFLHFFENITPRKYRINEKNKLIMESYLFMLGRLINNITCKTNLHKQHLPDI